MNRTFHDVFESSDKVYLAKIFGSANARNFTDICNVGVGSCPYHTDICKISRLSGALSLLVSDISYQ